MSLHAQLVVLRLKKETVQGTDCLWIMTDRSRKPEEPVEIPLLDEVRPSER